MNKPVIRYLGLMLVILLLVLSIPTFITAQKKKGRLSLTNWRGAVTVWGVTQREDWMPP